MPGENEIRAFVRTVPSSHSRPRVSKGGVYYSKATARVRKTLRSALLKFRQNPLMSGPLFLTMIFLYPRPKSLAADAWAHTSTPDFDNLAKHIDSAQGILIENDQDIVIATIVKAYTEDPDMVGIGIHLRPATKREVTDQVDFVDLLFEKV